MPAEHDPWIESFRETAVGWLLGPNAALDSLPEAVLLPMENPDVYDDGWIGEYATDLARRGTLTLGDVNGIRIAFSAPKFGAPAVAMAVDVFAKAGFRNVVGVGFCGGLQPEVQCGQLVLPRSVIRDEGASQHYTSEEGPAKCSPRPCDVALRCAQERGVRLHAGPIVTTDGILRETRGKVERWHAAGCLGVDMETAALYTVASVLGIEAVAILVASDNVYERKQTDLNLLREGWREAAALSVAVCRQVRTDQTK
jgi:uridine phosphorylase